MCCGDYEEHIHADVVFKRKRSCTDIFFLLLFIAAIGLSLLIFFRARELGGSPYAATHGRNFLGESCGEEGRPKYAAWPIVPIPSPTVTSEEASLYYRIKVCVADCNETNQQDNPNFAEPYESKPLWRFCMPVSTSSLSPNQLPSIPTETATMYISDLLTAWPIIAGSIGVATIIGFIYAKLMSFKCLRVVLIWGVILVILASCALLSYFLIEWSKTVEQHPLDTINRAKAANILGWVMVGVTIVLFLIIVVLRKRINYALRVIGSTSCALSQMRSTFLYPIFPILFAGGFAVWWVIVSLYIFTVGVKHSYALPPAYDNIPAFQTLTDKSFIVLEWNKTFEYLFIFHFFHLLWVNQFFSYAAYLTIAGALAQWYFAKPRNGDSDRNKERGGEDHQLSWFPITTSAFRVIRYHIGTVAFAALIIAIFQFIRAVITYIQHKTKGKDNRLVRCILCCLKCCLYCIQKCVDYVSRQALVVTAINGTNFCHSACTAFGLLTSNILRVTAFNVIATFVMFLGKVFISALTTCSCWIFMQYYYFVGDRATELSSPIFPLVIIFLLSWLIASMFMHIYTVSLECMFMCYLSDKKGEYTPKKIKNTFAKAEAREKALEEEGSPLVSNQSNEMASPKQGYYSDGVKSSNRDPYAR